MSFLEKKYGSVPLDSVQQCGAVFAVRPAGLIGNRTVDSGIIDGKTKSNAYLFPFVFRVFTDFLFAVPELADQLLPVPKIIFQQDDGKFIAADAKYRTVLENAANETACGL